MKDNIHIDSKLLKEFWARIMAKIIYLNNYFSTTFKEKVLEKLWNLKQDISYLIIFSYLAYVEISKKR